MKGLLAIVLCIVIIEVICVDASWRRRRRRRRSCSAVHCAWGNWQEWMPCSIACGTGGTQTRIRSVVMSASCGGATCSGLSEEQTTCSPGCTRGTAMAGHCANCPFPYTGSCCEQFIEGDPCTTHIEVNQPWRSINHPAEQDNSYRYTNMINYWYRFMGAGGLDMPTECVKTKRCGVLKPIWLFGVLPHSDEGTVARTVCTSESQDGDANCCTRNRSIEVKNCNTYNVYKLFQPPNCDEGFCAGEEAPCPIGTKSPNGYTPGCKCPPPFSSILPILELIEAATGGDFQFVCSFQVQQHSNISYTVKWYAAGVELHDFTTSVVDGTSAKLNAGQLRPIMVTSYVTISCSLTAQYVYSDGAAMSEPTVPVESNVLDFVVA